MTPTPIDRAAAVRAALRRLVARRGLHGASMSAVASEAGVATGTAYVHYRSKDELLRCGIRVASLVTAHAFDEATYDLVLSRFGAMFFNDPVAAFANVRKAMRPGGRS